MELDTRTAGYGPIFTGLYQSGKLIDIEHKPDIGSIVTLKSGGITILARIIEAGGSSYKGEIIGFERYDEHEYRGKRPGDPVKFTYENIFGCMR